MDKKDTAALLAMAGAFDRFIRVDELMVAGWQLALGDVSVDAAKHAVLEHYTGEKAHRPITPADILASVKRAARLVPSMVEADVRSAKARGLVSKDWPDRQQLAPDVMERLAAAREADRYESTRYEIEASA